MANELDPPNLFNPLSFWTDAGLNALDAAVSSTQNIGEGVDRLARAAAGAETADQALPATGAGIALPTDLGLAGLRMQRTTLDVMTQVWQQWINTFGTLASIGTGRRFKDAVERQNAWLNTAMQAASPSAWLEPGGGSRKRHSQGSAAEHAVASAEPKRRSRAARAKSKTGSRSSRNSRNQR